MAGAVVLAVLISIADNCRKTAPTFFADSETHAIRVGPTRHGAASGGSGRRRRGGGAAAGRRVRAVARTGPRPHGPAAARADPAADGAGPRGVPAPDRQE